MTTDDKLDAVIDLMEEQLKWLRVLGSSQIKKLFENEINTDSKKLIYHLSNGKNSVREIENKVGLSRTTVFNLWNNWYSLGLMKESKKYQGRFEHSFSLEDMGIPIPKINIKQSKKEKNNE